MRGKTILLVRFFFQPKKIVFLFISIKNEISHSVKEIVLAILMYYKL